MAVMVDYTVLFGNGILGGNSENKVVAQVVMTGTQVIFI